MREKSFFPGTRGGTFFSLDAASDGGFILGGVAYVPGEKMYLIKTDSLLYAEPIGIINSKNYIPYDYILYQNYPNAFNPKTSIKYDIPSGFSNDALVSLKIYDITGREIISITEQKSPGSYTYTFDGTNLASGVYFYRLEVRQAGSSTGDYVDSKKMLLIK